MAALPLSIEIMIETLRIWEDNNRNAWAAARSINIPSQTFQHRLMKAKEKFPNGVPDKISAKSWVYPRLVRKELPSTTWIIGSDLHIWEDEPPVIYKAFIKVAKSLKVDGIILNGDVIDGARISRHPSVRGSKAPKIEKEIEAAKKSEFEVGDKIIWDGNRYTVLAVANGEKNQWVWVAHQFDLEHVSLPITLNAEECKEA